MVADTRMRIGRGSPSPHTTCSVSSPCGRNARLCRRAFPRPRRPLRLPPRDEPAMDLDEGRPPLPAALPPLLLPAPALGLDGEAEAFLDSSASVINAPVVGALENRRDSAPVTALRNEMDARQREQRRTPLSTRFAHAQQHHASRTKQRKLDGISSCAWDPMGGHPRGHSWCVMCRPLVDPPASSPALITAATKRQLQATSVGRDIRWRASSYAALTVATLQRCARHTPQRSRPLARKKREAALENINVASITCCQSIKRWSVQRTGCNSSSCSNSSAPEKAKTDLLLALNASWALEPRPLRCGSTG